MLTLPTDIIDLLKPFATVFDKRTWWKARVLLVGSILTPHLRTVTAALRVMGLSADGNFAKFHHVLNRASWSARKLSELLLALLLQHFVRSDEPLVFGIDETIERRWGRRIKARGIYRDPVRSSKSHFVKASGLRWVSVMWLAYIPWAARVWALPVLTALAPSERYYADKTRAPKTLLDWARQMVFQLRRWLPGRNIVLVADNSYAALEFLHACQSLCEPVAVVTRLRLDAALYQPAPPREPKQLGRPRRKGARLPTLQALLDDPQTAWTKVTLDWYGNKQRTVEITAGTAVWYHSGMPTVPLRWVLIRDPEDKFKPQALLCTDRWADPIQVITWFVQRWQLEVTFEEVRTHLGVETQRQWSDTAIARVTPVLLGLFSWITLAAHKLHAHDPIPVRTAAWYAKPLPTFSDAIATVRRELWPLAGSFSMSPSQPDIVKVPRALLDRLLNLACYAT